MTIRKITNRTTSLAVSAVLITTGITKAHISQPSLIQKIAQATISLIPKAHATVGKLIDHILYEPGGYGDQFFYDYIFVSERPRFDIATTLPGQLVSVTEDIVVNYVRGRNPADTVTSDELIRFLLRTQRTFDDAVQPADRPYFYYAPAAINDAVLVDEFFFIARVRYNEDIVVPEDDYQRLITVSRTFDDSVGMIDAFTTIDGSTYSLNRTIREFVTVGTTAVAVDRLSGDDSENISFVILKYLDPDMELLSQVALRPIKGLFDQTDIAERPALRFDKPVDDAAAALSKPAKLLLRPVTDLLDSVTELLAQSFIKSVSDITVMIDNMDLGDDLTYASIKEIADQIGTADTDDLFINKSFNNVITAEQKFTQQVTKGILDEFVAESKLEPYWFNKGLSDDVVVLSELISLVRPKDYADVFTPVDFPALFVNKFLSDSFTADDPLVQVTDGTINFLLLQKAETVTAEEYFARSMNFIRYPHHGFLEFTTYPDAVTQILGFGVQHSIYENIPILRINKIYFSEQFGASYWGKPGTIIESDVIAPPDKVYSDPTLLYDPTYDATQVAEIFEGYQYRSPYGTDWFREVKLFSQTIAASAADLVREDTSAGEHGLEAVAESELQDLERFSFSIYVKAIDRNYIRLDIAGEFFAEFNIAEGQGRVLDTNAGIARVALVGSGGWYMIQIADQLPVSVGPDEPERQLIYETFLNAPDNPHAIRRMYLIPPVRTSEIKISILNDDLEPSYVGTGVDAFYVWGAQLEIGDQVEQEPSSLNYIKTVGGQNSKIGFNHMPRDKDRVWVGTLARDRYVYPNRTSGNAYERTDFLVLKNLYANADRTVSGTTVAAGSPDTVFAGQQYQGTGGNALFSYDPLERKSLIVDKIANQSVNRSVSGITVTAASPDRVFVGQQYGVATYSYDPLERKSLWVDKWTKRGYNDDITTLQQWVRTNELYYSEDFRPTYWLKNQTVVERNLLLTSGNLPYRDTRADAQQVYELTEQTIPNTYYQDRWYEIVPLSDLPDYTSNVVCDVFETPIEGEHILLTQIYNANQDDDVFSYGVYASPLGGVSRFRLQVNNNIFTDFDLSSVSVVTSNAVYYSDIETIDTANLVYLCRMVGPAIRVRELFIIQDVDELLTIDEEFDYVWDSKLTFDLSVSLSDVTQLDGVVDYQTGTGAEDYQTDSGSIDYATGA